MYTQQMTEGKQPIDGIKTNPLIVKEVTGLYPTRVDAVFTPGTIEQLQILIQQTKNPISIGGGRFSMGGQIAATDTIHIDMRGLNRVLSLDVEQRIIRVQAGIRWRDIQHHIDPHDLSIKIMQTYSDFTVGGSISVNCHGRYIGMGPLILSVRNLLVMMHDGELVTTSPDEKPELFYSIVGCYGAVAIVVEAELELVDNTRVERSRKKVTAAEYPAYFREHVRNNTDAVFHNADLYPPDFTRANAVTWSKTERAASTGERLNPGRRLYLLEKYFMWAITETPLGKWRREYIIDPLLFRKPIVHWRNYEAGYHVDELEPLFRDQRTYVLQEYFIPVETFAAFLPVMSEILNRHRVNVVNISVRHAYQDPGSLLAWAKGETFAFVLYYKQRTSKHAREQVAVWTRELIDAVIENNGRYYLPYQPHATAAQFHKAYPQAEELFARKREYDPDYRFRNCLWEKYYAAEDKDIAQDKPAVNEDSEFKKIYSDTEWRDRFYLFLQNIYNLYPEDQFHSLIMEASEECDNDEAIYQRIQDSLPEIKPVLRDIRYALPALMKQKRMIAEQTKLLAGHRSYIGYLEIGSTGRYVKPLQKALDLRGPVYLSNYTAPDNSPAEIMERGGIAQVGTYFDLNEYEPISETLIADASLDLVTCFIGLHHCSPEDLDAYIESIARVLREDGVFILRDHDAADPDMVVFVSLVHTVFNAGLDVKWKNNLNEKRFFNSVDHWIKVMQKHGFEPQEQRLLQEHDPSLNTLMAFVKKAHC